MNMTALRDKLICTVKRTYKQCSIPVFCPSPHIYSPAPIHEHQKPYHPSHNGKGENRDINSDEVSLKKGHLVPKYDPQVVQPLWCDTIVIFHVYPKTDDDGNKY